MRFLILLVLMLNIVSCKEEQKLNSYKESSFGKEISLTIDDEAELMPYLIIDKSGCLHTSRRCDCLKQNYQIRYVDKNDLHVGDYTSVCAECVSFYNSKLIENMKMKP